MLRREVLFLATAILSVAAVAQTDAAKKQSNPPGGAASQASSDKPVSRPKSFDIDAMDKSVDPCTDFYEYSCGTWRKKNPIPPDQARWGRFNELAEYNRQVLHEILEKASANDPKRSPVMQKIGDFYQSCMDEQAVDAKGSAPLKPALDRIAAVHDRASLIDTIAYLQSNGVPVLFGFRSAPDLHDASMEIANVSQGGLGLPDRDYYIATDPKSQETREKYQAHVAKMLALLGDNDTTAKKEADAVMAIETRLAQASMERVKLRDPKNRDHKMKLSELATLAPSFDFQRIFEGTGAPKFEQVNVVAPDFFQQTNAALDSIPLDDWKTYYAGTWCVPTRLCCRNHSSTRTLTFTENFFPGSKFSRPAGNAVCR
jgi:putative endopeptidase